MLRRIAFVGRTARFNRSIIDLDYPPRSVSPRLIIIEHDEDIHMLSGYMPDEIAFIPQDISPYQMDWLRSRRHKEITLDEAKAFFAGLAALRKPAPSPLSPFTASVGS
jgi:hypothetical protein